MASEEEDVPSNKITPLYPPKQRMFSPEWAREGTWLWSKTSMQVAISPSGGKIPRYTSGDPARAQFSLKTRNYFGNKLSGTFGSFFFFSPAALMMCRVRAAIERYVPLNWNSKRTQQPIAFQ